MLHIIHNIYSNSKQTWYIPSIQSYKNDTKKEAYNSSKCIRTLTNAHINAQELYSIKYDRQAPKYDTIKHTKAARIHADNNSTHTCRQQQHAYRQQQHTYMQQTIIQQYVYMKQTTATHKQTTATRIHAAENYTAIRIYEADNSNIQTDNSNTHAYITEQHG